MPYTLLLADDSVTIQRVIELTFADEDVRVVAVGDGRQAIDRINREPPDIVLADVGMPRCDGYEVAAFVKNRSDLAHIPVLLLTGAFEPVDEARVRQVRADGVLAKPFEPQELITRVKVLLFAGVEEPASEAVPLTRGTEYGASDAGPLAPGEQGGSLPAAAGEGGVASSGGSVSLDDYFDRLDAAFASLSVPSHIEAGAGAAPSAPQPAWRDHEAAPDAAPRSARYEAPSSGGTDRAAPSPSSASGLTPATAFTAILEAEQAGLPAQPSGSGPVGLGLPPAYPPVEQLVEDVARRVIAQLSDGIVRETVADVVSAVAERLVREEIERIKNSIA